EATNATTFTFLLSSLPRDEKLIGGKVEDRRDPQAEVIRGYCAAVRGALSESGHPPLQAGGLQLQERLSAITASLGRLVEKGGS
ncbi:MAG: hypothetical protein KDJ22_09375, partial [Candidatus Competibacteraceae bacterium]|nr:hypothetical protein [Candidatus Competibacteraceae bacterium]